MAITVKKYCCICGNEIPEEEEIYETCTTGIIRVENNTYCNIHKKNKETPTSDNNPEKD